MPLSAPVLITVALSISTMPFVLPEPANIPLKSISEFPVKVTDCPPVALISQASVKLIVSPDVLPITRLASWSNLIFEDLNSEVGIITRLESFIDILTNIKEGEKND